MRHSDLMLIRGRLYGGNREQIRQENQNEETGEEATHDPL